jgi:hypothetical protein
MALLLAIGGALATLVAAETAIASRYRDGIEAFYAAEAAIEIAIARLRATPDWSALLGGRSGWQPYARTSLAEIAPAAGARPPVDLDVRVRDAGAGTLGVRAAARGAPGVRRTVEVIVVRAGSDVRVVWWREHR